MNPFRSKWRGHQNTNGDSLMWTYRNILLSYCCVCVILCQMLSFVLYPSSFWVLEFGCSCCSESICFVSQKVLLISVFRPFVFSKFVNMQLLSICVAELMNFLVFNRELLCFLEFNTLLRSMFNANWFFFFAFSHATNFAIKYSFD